MTPIALVALACYAAQPAPAVSSPVYRALMGEAVAPAPARADVAAAIEAVAPLRHRTPRGRR